MKRFEMGLLEKQDDELAAISERTGIPKATLGRLALDQWLEDQRRQQPQEPAAAA